MTAAARITVATSPAKAVSVQVVASSAAIRSAIRASLLALAPAVEVVGLSPHLDIEHARECDVLMVEPSVLGSDPVAALATIKKARPAPLVIGVMERIAPSLLAGLLRNGMDDFVRAPCHPDELRVRLRDATPHAHESSRPGPTAMQRLPEVLCGDMSVLVGSEVAASMPPTIGADVVGATVTLTQPDGQMLRTVRLEMARPTAVSLVGAVLGSEPDREAVDDFLKELANLSGGALKRLLLDESTTFTLGLPEVLTTSTCAVDDVDGHFGLVTRFGPMRCIVTMRRTRLVALPLHALREGLVLARELRAANGMLLLGAGVRLTSNAIAGLQRALDRGAQVEVVGAD